MFEKNIEKVCEANNITGILRLIEAQQFQLNLNHYKEDGEIKQLINLSEKEFEISLTGRVPSFPVQVPESLTK